VERGLAQGARPGTAGVAAHALTPVAEGGEVTTRSRPSMVTPRHPTRTLGRSAIQALSLWLTTFSDIVIGTEPKAVGPGAPWNGGGPPNRDPPSCLRRPEAAPLPTGRYGGGLPEREAGPAPLRDCLGAEPGRSRERLDEGGEAQSPYVGKRTGKGESATRSRTTRTTEWGAPLNLPRPPLRGPVERALLSIILGQQRRILELERSGGILLGTARHHPPLTSELPNGQQTLAPG
jgi:hypothetical protein